MRRWVDAVGVAVLTVVVRVLYGEGVIGYDANWALIWGRDIGRGEMPEFEWRFAPTPHPLANLLSAPISWLGDSAFDAVMLLSAISFAALVWYGFRLGWALFSIPVGVVFALILLTRRTFVNEAAHAFVDIPFLALVLAAAGVEARRRISWVPVLVLLGVAGLLRPEAWGFAGAYFLYLLPQVDARARVRAFVLTAAPVVIWVAFDAVVTGDPLYSIHGTKALAAELSLPRELGTAAQSAPEALETVLRAEVIWLGFAGAILALALLYERALLPFALVALGIASFLALGLAGLPVLKRYLLIPAIMLALFAGVAAFGWLSLRRDHRARRPWAIAGPLVVVAVLALSVPPTVRELRDFTDFMDQRHAVRTQLEELTASGPVRASVGRCRVLAAPEYQVVPLLAYMLDHHAQSIAVDPEGDVADGTTLIAYSSPRVAKLVSVVGRKPAPLTRVQPGTEAIGSRTSWIAYQRRC